MAKEKIMTTQFEKNFFNLAIFDLSNYFGTFGVQVYLFFILNHEYITLHLFF